MISPLFPFLGNAEIEYVKDGERDKRGALALLVYPSALSPLRYCFYGGLGF